MSLTANAEWLQALTYSMLPLRFAPPVVWFFWVLSDTLFTNSWLTPLLVVDNIKTIIVTLFDSWTVWIAALLLSPTDWWITYELFQIPTTEKVAGGVREQNVRDASWTVFTYSAVMTGMYAVFALVMDIFKGPLTTIEAKSIVQLFSAFFGLMTSVSYLYTVNAYAPYL